MKAEILSVGNELLRGEVVDTNAAYLAARLPLLGAEVQWVSQVGDDRDRLCECLSRAWGRSDLIVTTGGLGPTDDDLTRECIAAMLGEEMYVDPGLEKWLRDFFAGLGYQMPERNIKQAMLVPSARAIPNPRGTAPGWWVERDGHIALALPGPPVEMQRMWEKEVWNELREKLVGQVILVRALKTWGLSEGAVDEKVSPVVAETRAGLGVYAKPDGIEVRLVAKAPGQQEAEYILSEAEARVRAVVGDRIWGVDEDVMEGLVGNLLAERGLTLATMESCTGGLLASTITDVAGSSSYFKGGIVAYTNEVKIAHGVGPQTIAEYGAVSPETAVAMAEAARRHLGADVGVGITGVAGPGTLEGKPPGTVHIGLAMDGRSRTFSGKYPPRRPDVKRRACYAALFELRRLLLNSA